MNSYKNKTKRKLPVRTDEALRTRIKFRYEKQRMNKLLNDDPIPSLNQFICDLLALGLEAHDVPDDSGVAMA